MKKALSIFAVTALAVSATAQVTITGNNTRFDFLNKDGERIASKTVEMDPNYLYSWSNLFGISLNQSTGLFDISMDGNALTEPFSIKMVPWATESYPMEVETPQEDVKVEYEIVGESENKRTRSGEGNILCGKTIKFTIEVPDGEYPVIKIYNKYTSDSFSSQKAWKLNPFLNLFRYGSSSGPTSNERQNVWETYTSTAPFTRDSTNPNVWYITQTMPNEPVLFSFESEKLDGRLLNESVRATMRILYCQHSGSYQNNCGEPFTQMFYGETPSSDLLPGVLGNSTFRDYPTYKQYSSQPTAWINIVGWGNSFGYIAEANFLLELLDNFTSATSDEKNEARAQLLTLRSHAYWRLLQLYGKRWNESDGGNALCAPLETAFATSPLPMASMKEIITQCYKDLDWAIQFLPANHDEIMMPDVNVARGVKMRIAILCEDWNTVKEMSEKILANKPLTTNEGLLAGFFNPEDSWIWGAWNRDENGADRLYYWSFQNSHACNGHYPTAWGRGANAINRDLFCKMAENDIRRLMFVMPENATSVLPLDNWYVSNYFKMGSGSYPTVFNETYARSFRAYFSNRKPQGVTASPFYNNRGSVMPVLFGSQMKFFSSCSPEDVHGVNAVVLMRSDEALLANAEANFRLGNEEECRRQLKVLNGMRQEGYDVTATGDELFEEICRSYKIELWGEGHSWFNDKRWGKTLVRKPWVEGDTNSGNWFNQIDNTLLPEDCNGWRMIIPQGAVNDNPYIDINAMGYDNADYSSGAASKPAKSNKNTNVKTSVIVKDITTEAKQEVQNMAE